MTDVARRQGSVSPHGARFRVRLTIDGKQRHGGVYDTREEAESVLAGALAELGDKHATTLRGWGAKWLDMRETLGLHRDVAADRSRWTKHVLSQSWADEPLDAITSRTLRAWVADLIRLGLARQTISNVVVLLRVALRDAVEAEMLESNPAADVRVPKMARTDEPWTYLRGAEISALLAHPALPDYQRAVFTVAIYTGAREGELFSLRWRDVEDRGERPELVLRTSWRGPRKNGAVLRVPLLPPALDALRAWRRLRPALPAALVFPADDGTMRGRGYDGAWAETWRAKTGTRAEVRFHDFRHTAGASLVSGTFGRPWSLEEVKGFLGHSTIKMTERYAHLAPDALHAAAAATPGLKTRSKT